MMSEHQPANLRRELTNRLRQERCPALILSERTTSSAGLPSWEIEVAADRCKLPIICTYTGCRDLHSDETANSAWWPDVLREIITGGRARTFMSPSTLVTLAQAFRGVTASTELGAARTD